MSVCSLGISACFPLQPRLTCFLGAGSFRQTHRAKASLASKKCRSAYSGKVSHAGTALRYSSGCTELGTTVHAKTSA